MAWRVGHPGIALIAIQYGGERYPMSAMSIPVRYSLLCVA
jgi:hypothetical protein